MRTIPECPPVPEVDILKCLKRYKIDVLTPIFGGGHNAGEIEDKPEMFIRVSSIRGHLRFWWRATTGRSIVNPDDLRKNEDELWGSTKKPSRVNISVEIEKNGRTEPYSNIIAGRNALKYVLFPFQEIQGENQPEKHCRSGIGFNLIISCPEEKSDEINKAIIAWVNFGGIGARTRRGCGALFCEELSPPSDVKKFSQWYEQFQVSNPVIDPKWPVLPNKINLKRGERDPLTNWNHTVDLFQKFRQGQNIGRNIGDGNIPKRSRWPEPEGIRGITNRRFSRHQLINHFPKDPFFPRSEFGLPIIFQFRRNDESAGDPHSSELYPVVNGKEQTRMSSPIIIRPVKCKDGSSFQMIMVLDAPKVIEVVLKKNGDTFYKTKKIRGEELGSYTNSPMGPPKPGFPPRSSSGSAIEAFIAFSKENGFIEV